MNCVELSKSNLPKGAWQCFAVSLDGKHVLAGQFIGKLLTSSDYGSTWNQPNEPRGIWNCAAMSEDGKYQLAGCGFLIRSCDYGQTWSTVFAETGNGNWRTVALSADGRCQLAGTDQKLFFSTERGLANWKRTSTPEGDWTCAALNSDGQFQVAGQSEGCVFQSSDFGQTWTQSQSPAGKWTCVSMRADGEVRLAIKDGLLFVQRTPALAWEEVNTPDLCSFCLLGSGDVYVIVGQTGIYSSSDGGRSWLLAGSSSQFENGLFIAVVSRDTEFVILADTLGHLHTSRRPGPEQTETIANSRKTAFQKALIEREFCRRISDILRRKVELRVRRDQILSDFATKKRALEEQHLRDLQQLRELQQKLYNEELVCEFEKKEELAALECQTDAVSKALPVATLGDPKTVQEKNHSLFNKINKLLLFIIDQVNVTVSDHNVAHYCDCIARKYPSCAAEASEIAEICISCSQSKVPIECDSVLAGRLGAVLATLCTKLDVQKTSDVTI